MDDNTLAQLFKYSESKGFKLFFSLDLYAAANACSGGSSGSCGGVSETQPSLTLSFADDSYPKAQQLLSIAINVSWQLCMVQRKEWATNDIDFLVSRVGKTGMDR
jgi:hypothetical protein